MESNRVSIQFTVRVLLKFTIMIFVQIFVSLKIPDNIARSALYVCQNRLGLREIHHLHRAEFWQLEWSDFSTEQALNTTSHLITKTFHFVNPNKHRWRIKAARQSIENVTEVELSEGIGASVWVTDRNDCRGEATLHDLQRILSKQQCPQRALSGTWWDVEFSRMSHEDVHSLLDRLVVTRYRTQGLLVNPHYQTYKIFFSSCPALAKR